MLVFIARRLAYAALTVVAVSLVAFFIIELAPGSAITAEISRLRAQGNVVSDAQVQALEEQYGINDPWIVKYGKWAGGLLTGDFGQSFAFREPVADLIWSRLGLSIALSVGAIIIAWAVAIPIGVYSATHRYSLPDNVITVIQFVGVAIPEFLLALAVMTAAVRWGGIEVGGLFSNEYRNAEWSAAKFADMLGHLWMPLVVITVGSTAWLTRVMRANLFDVLGQQYIQTARAKGVSESRVIWKHAVRNALHPLVMTFGTTLSALISGEAIVSIVFALPTTGQALLQSLIVKDTYVAATLLVFLSILLVIGNVISDLALAWIDPRARTAS
ncbi:ABC transporter permease [Auraticoccus monumenti]|uniref:Peptide/nickel transport system permease protein n=1 Tax=Auraticoccus monumenti TaxID=675864 RepID=A0A1G7CXD7_9ACTN|nr:ABC transporter permease [Auraticoccus monumenti]SDE43145.1 peptide/nickel transport system permease protein [Auraticoccus monumenti]